MIRTPKYSKEEHSLRGQEIYEKLVRAKVESISRGKIVAIDVDTGDFEIADDGLTAADRLLSRRPNAQIWCVRIGIRPCIVLDRAGQECLNVSWYGSRVSRCLCRYLDHSSS